jgi:hypothetical protein
MPDRFRFAAPYAALLSLLLAAGCGPKNGGDPAGPVKPTANGKTTKPVKPEPKPKQTRFQRVLYDYVNGRIPPTPARKDGLEEDSGWKVAAWEDLALCKKFTDKKKGRTLMYLATGGGKKGKCAAVLTKELCLAPKGALRLSAYNPSNIPVEIGVAFWFSGSWVYYESTTQPLPPGKWKTFSFDLAAGTYKTASRKWKHTASLWKCAETQQLAVLVHTGGKPARVLLNGLTVDQAPRPKPKPKAEPRKGKPVKSGPPPEDEPPPIKGGKKKRDKPAPKADPTSVQIKP